ENQRGYTWVELADGTVIYSCYFSPNRPHAEFTAYLDLLGQDIDRKTCQKKIIVTGDFNASAHEWGAGQTDVRGRELNEWLAQRDMVVINEGSTPTFQRRASQVAFIDVTLATAEVAQRIQKWRVHENIESLSDHRDKGRINRRSARQAAALAQSK
ncbi:Pol protein-like, partial [Tropilaelaps mercedesae]